MDFSEHASDESNGSDDEYTYRNGNKAIHPAVHADLPNGYAMALGDSYNKLVHKKMHGAHHQAEFETVGCTAVDISGNCAAATSTGGLVNKMTGRIGKLACLRNLRTT